MTQTNVCIISEVREIPRDVDFATISGAELCEHKGFQEDVEKASDKIYLVEVRDKFYFVAGVVRKSLCGTAVFWVLFGKEFERDWRTGAKFARKAIRVLINEYGPLETLVEKGNRAAVRTAKFCGWETDGSEIVVMDKTFLIYRVG